MRRGGRQSPRSRQLNRKPPAGGFRLSGTRGSKEPEPPSSSDTSDAREPSLTAGEAAVALLAAVRSGDERSERLAAELAALVLADAGVALAHAVVAGGPLLFAHAVRLACHVLDRDASAFLARAAGAGHGR